MNEKIKSCAEYKKLTNVESIHELLPVIFLLFDVEEYYALEIDDKAIFVSRFIHGKKIKYLGDVREITEEKIRKILPIHLLIGGSPCNDLSSANPN